MLATFGPCHGLKVAGIPAAGVAEPVASPQEQAFRDELRAWLAENAPGREPEGDLAGFEFRRDWQRRMHAAGWAGVAWPREYGGGPAPPLGEGGYNDARPPPPPPRP